jgi:5-methylcytosine-specific restriction enzyme subunit McrC
LQAARYRTPGLAGRLRYLARALGAAALTPGGPPRGLRFDFNRLNERYRPALALAQLLLDHLTLSGAAGEEPFLAFLVEMSWLFERYVSAVLGAAAPAWGLSAHTQERHPLDAAQRLVVRPDVILYRGSAPVLVVDAKYKLSAAEGDVYQMLAYCHTLGLPRGVLIHPGHERAPAGELLLRGPAPVRVTYVALGLQGGPQEVAGHAAEVAQRVGQLAEAS